MGGIIVEEFTLNFTLTLKFTLNFGEDSRIFEGLGPLQSKILATPMFLPLDFFLAPPRYFFGRKKLVLLGGKNVKICDFGQKKPSDCGEDLFFFGDHLLLVGKFVISARKNLRISAKTFAPLILILSPRSRESGDAPGLLLKR